MSDLTQITERHRSPGDKRSVALIISDTHGGHKFGLCPKDVKLYDEGPDGQLIPDTPRLTAFQEMLLELLVGRIIPEAAKLAGDDPLDIFHLGDPIHGVKHPAELMTTRTADQIEIALANYGLIIPQLPTLRTIRMCVGTDAHELGEGTATILIASSLAKSYPQINIRPLFYGLADVGGCTIDYSHHGPGVSQRVWLDGNTARFYLRNIMLDDICHGKRPPDLVLRGHVHTPINEVVSIPYGDGIAESRLIVCPPLCGPGAWARQALRSIRRVSVGAVLIEIIDGRPMTPVWITESFDVRTKEQL